MTKLETMINEMSREEQIDLVKELAIFTINEELFRSNEVDGRYLSEVYFSLNSDIALSKVNFALLCKIDKEKNKTFYKKVNLRDMSTQDFKNLLIISIKTRNYGVDKLVTILENRLDGLYKRKFKDGKNWNEGSIEM